MKHRGVDAAIQSPFLQHRDLSAKHVVHRQSHLAGGGEFEREGCERGEGIGIICSDFDGRGDDTVKEPPSTLSKPQSVIMVSKVSLRATAVSQISRTTFGGERR